MNRVNGRMKRATTLDVERGEWGIRDTWGETTGEGTDKEERRRGQTYMYMKMNTSCCKNVLVVIVAVLLREGY